MPCSCKPPVAPAATPTPTVVPSATAIPTVAVAAPTATAAPAVPSVVRFVTVTDVTDSAFTVVLATANATVGNIVANLQRKSGKNWKTVSSDIANATLFLVAPENEYMTGSVVTVDGGWTAV